MKSNTKTAKVGLFTFIGLALLAGGIVVLSNMRKIFVSKVKAEATFADVAGLTPGNNVWLAGVKVGTVTDLDFVPGKGVEVVFAIEEASQKYIFKDADIKISTDGLIGNPILVISGGTPAAGSIDNGHVFKVQSEDSQQDMLKTLQANNKNILSITDNLKTLLADINDGKGSVGMLLKDEALYNQLNGTMNQLQTASYQISGMSQNLNNFSKGLNDPQSLPYQLTHDTQIMPSLQSTAKELASGTAKLSNTADEASVFVSKFTQDLDQKLNDPNTALGVLINDHKVASDLKVTFSNVASGTEKLDENLEALQHSIFFRRYFKKKEQEKKEAEAAKLSKL